MTLSENLFKAILAMDAYHRGLDGGLNGNYPPSSHADNLAIPRHPGVPNVPLDGWLLQVVPLPAGSDIIGFSAEIYTKGPETVIAYRGADGAVADAPVRCA